MRLFVIIALFVSLLASIYLVHGIDAGPGLLAQASAMFGGVLVLTSILFMITMTAVLVPQQRRVPLLVLKC